MRRVLVPIAGSILALLVGLAVGLQIQVIECKSLLSEAIREADVSDALISASESVTVADHFRKERPQDGFRKLDDMLERSRFQLELFHRQEDVSPRSKELIEGVLQRITEYRAQHPRVTGEAEEMARGFRLAPVISGGEIVGVRAAVSPSGPLSGLGLAIDDVITSVDGALIVRPADIRELSDLLESGATVELTVKNGGVTRSIRVPGNSAQ